MIVIKFKHYLFLLLFLLLISSCSNNKPQFNTGKKIKPGSQVSISKTNYSFVATSFNKIPDWDNQNFVNSLNTFKKSCIKLNVDPKWEKVCLKSENNFNNIQAKYFFEKNFTPWTIKLNAHQATGIITGYYQPIIQGSLAKSLYAYFPIYGIPDDFISVPINDQQRKRSIVKIAITKKNFGIIKSDGQYQANLKDFYLPANINFLKGRIDGNYFVPYYSRAKINSGALNNKAPILAYASDPIDLFFLHIQGSGILKTKDYYIYLKYADTNGLPFKSIAKYMSEKGYLSLSQANKENIKLWLKNNPYKLSEILSTNPSYVFFSSIKSNNSIVEDNMAIGALGIPLTCEYSAAVDKNFIPLGSPIFISTTDPKDNGNLNRLIMAQDTGSAIKGVVRVDYFLGNGKLAGQLANKMKYDVYVWVLIPNGQYPKN